MINASINVKALNKEKFVKGKKGTYVNITLIPTPDDKYGNDYVVVQGLSKEDREKGEKGAILGNAKNFKKKENDSTDW